MWIADNWTEYTVLDCGGGEKAERWGDQILIRPDPQAIWPKIDTEPCWRRANAIYHRSNAGGGKWDPPFFRKTQHSTAQVHRA